MKIYAVSEGRYSDYRIVALFSSSDKAQEFIDEIHGDRIEEYELDPPDVDMRRQGYRVWYISMQRNGDLHLAADGYNSNDIEEDPEIKCHYVPYLQEYACYRTLWAKSKEHAIKIVNEQRAQLIAEGKWPS